MKDLIKFRKAKLTNNLPEKGLRLNFHICLHLRGMMQFHFVILIEIHSQNYYGNLHTIKTTHLKKYKYVRKDEISSDKDAQEKYFIYVFFIKRY